MKSRLEALGQQGVTEHVRHQGLFNRFSLQLDVGHLAGLWSDGRVEQEKVQLGFLFQERFRACPDGGWGSQIEWEVVQPDPVQDIVIAIRGVNLRSDGGEPARGRG
jgi:hypothetical protein